MHRGEWKISRSPGVAPGRSSGSAYGPLVWLVASAADKAGDLTAQVNESLAKVERVLAELGTNKGHILSTTVFLADYGSKPQFDRIWLEWIGNNPQAWPQRACVGASLSPGTLVEITVVAARITRS